MTSRSGYVGIVLSDPEDSNHSLLVEYQEGQFRLTVRDVDVQTQVCLRPEQIDLLIRWKQGVVDQIGAEARSLMGG